MQALPRFERETALFVDAACTQPLLLLMGAGTCGPAEEYPLRMSIGLPGAPSEQVSVFSLGAETAFAEVFDFSGTTCSPLGIGLTGHPLEPLDATIYPIAMEGMDP